MNRLLLLICLVLIASTTEAQLPKRVQKLEGLWEYRAGSGFEDWRFKGDRMVGTSFRINKLGDTLVAERFEIAYINKRLVMDLKAYHTVGDSLVVRQKTLIGKRRKMEFTNVSGVAIEKLRYRFGFFSKRRLKLLVYHQRDMKPQKLVLLKR
jgi:hypothetical protein